MKRFIIRAVAVIVAIGILANVVAFLTRRFIASDPHEDDDEFDLLNVFGGSEFHSRAGALRTGTVRTIMGGTELDLRDAELAPGGAYLEVMTACGGTEIVVPPDWRVDVIGVPQAGGHEIDVTDPDELPADAPHLVIHARTMMGGLDIAVENGDRARVNGAAAEV